MERSMIDIFNKLGGGRYGTVYRAKLRQGGSECAAKYLNSEFFQHKAASKFRDECDLMSRIKHPNIMQYLGNIPDPTTDQPVLLMELMDESLTKFLERQTEPLPYHVQVNFSLDISQALAYLHANGIVHRDLSSNNVLLSAGCRAKVADFGMAKLIDAKTFMTHLTECPGTRVYMPPEALVSADPLYTEKLDCFSDGVLMIQIMTGNYPNPSDRFKAMVDLRSCTGVIHVPVPEMECRSNDIDLIHRSHPGHPLLPIALKCINDKESERPSAQKLCHRIAALKEDPQYPISMQSEKETNLKKIIQQQNQQLHKLNQLLIAKSEQLQAKNKELREKENELQQKDRELEQARQQLQQLRQNPIGGQRESHIEKKIQLSWQSCDRPPCKGMGRGAYAIVGNTAYIRPHHSQDLYKYDMANNKWSPKPINCLYAGFGLAVIKGVVTTIGGHESSGERLATNALLSLTKETTWSSEQFPAMCTKRYYPNVVYDGDSVVVAGGETDECVPVAAVEVLNTKTRKWSTASSLPQPIADASMTIVGCSIYLLGGGAREDRSKSVLSCSLPALIQSCQQENKPILWHQVADIPVYWSTCATLGGELVAAGGQDDENKETTAVRIFDPQTNSWKVISHVQQARDFSLLCTFRDNRLFVFGGWNTDTVEMGTIQ